MPLEFPPSRQMLRAVKSDAIVTPEEAAPYTRGTGKVVWDKNNNKLYEWSDERGDPDYHHYTLQTQIYPPGEDWFAIPPGVHHYNINDGYLQHWRSAENEDPNEIFQAFPGRYKGTTGWEGKNKWVKRDPEGNVVDEDAWKFTKVAAKVVHLPGDDSYFDEGDPSREGEHPVIYHPEHDTIYVGDQNTHHADLWDKIRTQEDSIVPWTDPYEMTSDQLGSGGDADRLGLKYALITERKGLQTWGQWNPEHTQALHEAGYLDHPDGSIHTDLNWNLSKVGATQIQNGGHEYYSAGRGHLISEPWQEGDYGKAMQVGDTFHVWKTDGEGYGPHHSQVIAPLVGLDTKSGPAYLISPDGSAQGYYHTPKYDAQVPPPFKPITNEPNEWSTWYFSKVAGLTRNQYLRQMAELEAKMGPDKSKPVYQFGNGWSIVAPKTQRDVKRTGTLMGHCWQSGFAGRGDPHVLRDPYGIPRIAFNVCDDAGRGDGDSYMPNGANDPWQKVIVNSGTHAPAGHNNSAPKPEHWGMLREWGNTFDPPLQMAHWTGGQNPEFTSQYELGDLGPNPFWDPTTQSWIPKDQVRLSRTEQWSLAKVSSKHLLNWDEGNDGKGLVFDDGSFHTWNVDHMRMPNHVAYLKELGEYDEPQDLDRVKGFYEITPEGTISNADAFNPESEPFIQEAVKLDPRLRPADKNWTIQTKFDKMIPSHRWSLA